MKKILIAAALAVSLSAVAVACDNGDDATPEPSEAPAVEAVESMAAEAEETMAAVESMAAEAEETMEAVESMAAEAVESMAAEVEDAG